MDQKAISIATITWARDDQEEDVLRTSLTHLARLNRPVFITDGGSKPSFVTFLRSFPHFKVLDFNEKGVWMQAKNSLWAAHQSQTPFVFYTEPDKSDFFAHSLPDLFSQLSIDDQSGVLLMARSEKAMATFPAFQQMTENTINHCCAEVIGLPVDYTYGPFLLNAKVIPYLNHVAQHVAWGWRPYAFHVAKRLGYRVEAITGDFFCPTDQRTDTPAERIYRMRQLSQNLEGLLLSTTFAPS